MSVVVLIGCLGASAGIRANFSSVEVLKLAADVVGNLASLDESAFDAEAGIKVPSRSRRIG